MAHSAEESDHIKALAAKMENAEAELREAKEQLRKLTEGSPESIVTAATERVKTANERLSAREKDWANALAAAALSHSGFGRPLPDRVMAELLRQANIHRPDSKVLQRMKSQFAHRFLLACELQDAELARLLYDDAKLLPGTGTSKTLQVQHNILLNGPLVDFRPNILSATSAEGAPMVIKVLGPSTQDGEQYTEALICEQLQLNQVTPATPLASITVIRMQLTDADSQTTGHGPGTYTFLAMPEYKVLQQMPQLPLSAITRGALRMKEALQILHGRSLVHMDIKAENIFVNHRGQWFLGDFGSAVQVGSAVGDTTDCFLPRYMKGSPAEQKTDWWLLAVTLLITVNKVDEGSALLDKASGRVSIEKVVAAVASVQDQALVTLLNEFLQGWM